MREKWHPDYEAIQNHQVEEITTMLREDQRPLFARRLGKRRAKLVGGAGLDCQQGLGRSGGQLRIQQQLAKRRPEFST